MLKTTRQGWQIQPIGVGTWGFGGHFGPISTEDVQSVVNSALDQGVDFFDTADCYGIPPGLVEERLAAALGKHNSEVFICTKVGNFCRRLGHPISFGSVYHVELCCDASLHRLRRDTIDVILCHIADPDSPEIWVEACQRLLKAGKIRAWGISTNYLSSVKRMNQSGDCSFVELEYNLLKRSAEHDLLPYCKDNHIATIVRSPLNQGLLCGHIKSDTFFEDAARYRWNEGQPGREEFLDALSQMERIQSVAHESSGVVDLALGFILANPAVTVVVPGARSAAQVSANCMARPLKASVMHKLSSLDRVH